jgi:dephospho-CoA kinase
MPKIIALVGLPGAGKSTIAKMLEERGFFRVRLGDATDEELKRQGLERTPENEKKMRVELRQKFGMDAYAKLNVNRIKGHDKVVVDDLISYEEFLYLKEIFGNDVKLVLVQASKDRRYERLENRAVRPLTAEECADRDHNQLIQGNMKATIEHAQYKISNEGMLHETEKQVERILSYL